MTTTKRTEKRSCIQNINQFEEVHVFVFLAGRSVVGNAHLRGEALKTLFEYETMRCDSIELP